MKLKDDKEEDRVLEIQKKSTQVEMMPRRQKFFKEKQENFCKVSIRIMKLLSSWLMDGSSFPSNKNFSKRRAGCCARVFIHGEEYCYENSIFLGDQDSVYAELYSFIESLEVLYLVIAQLKIVPHTTFHFLTDSKEARYLFFCPKLPPKNTPNLYYL